MANLLTKLFSAGASSLVEAVGNAIDKTTTTDEERKALDNEMARATMQYEVQMAALTLQEKQAILADVASAREQQTQVQQSPYASRLARNVQPILALAIIGLTFAMYAYVIFDFGGKLSAPNSPMKDIVIYILGALTTVATQVVSYFFGSSAGSADKTKTIETMMKKGSTG